MKVIIGTWLKYVSFHSHPPNSVSLSQKVQSKLGKEKYSFLHELPNYMVASVSLSNSVCSHLFLLRKSKPRSILATGYIQLEIFLYFTFKEIYAKLFWTNPTHRGEQREKGKNVMSWSFMSFTVVNTLSCQEYNAGKNVLNQTTTSPDFSVSRNCKLLQGLNVIF